MKNSEFSNRETLKIGEMQSVPVSCNLLSMKAVYISAGISKNSIDVTALFTFNNNRRYSL